MAIARSSGVFERPYLYVRVIALGYAVIFAYLSFVLGRRGNARLPRALLTKTGWRELDSQPGKETRDVVLWTSQPGKIQLANERCKGSARAAATPNRCSLPGHFSSKVLSSVSTKIKPQAGIYHLEEVSFNRTSPIYLTDF